MIFMCFGLFNVYSQNLIKSNSSLINGSHAMDLLDCCIAMTKWTISSLVMSH